MSALQVTIETTSRKCTVRNTGALKRGDTGVAVELTRTTDSVATRFDEGVEIFLGIKALEAFTGDSLISCDTWTRGETDDDPYTGTLDLSGEALDTLIASTTLLKCALEVVVDGVTYDAAPVTVKNDYTRDGDSPPTPSATFAERIADTFAANVAHDPETGLNTISGVSGGSSGDLMFISAGDLMFA